MTLCTPKLGRPTVLTPSVVGKLTEALKLDITVEEACTYAGISKDTYYDHMKRDSAFSDEMERAKMYATMRARQVVIRQIDEGDGDLALRYLERKRREEFSLRTEQQVEQKTLTQTLREHEAATQPVDWSATFNDVELAQAA